MSHIRKLRTPTEALSRALRDLWTTLRQRLCLGDKPALRPSPQQGDEGRERAPSHGARLAREPPQRAERGMDTASRSFLCERRRRRRTLDVRAADLQEEMAEQRFSVPSAPTKTAATQRTSQRAERAIKQSAMREQPPKGPLRPAVTRQFLRCRDRHAPRARR